MSGITWALLAVAVLLAPAPAGRTLLGSTATSVPWRWTSPAEQRGQLRAAAVAWVMSVAAELRAGSDLDLAVLRCTATHGVTLHGAAAARVGGSVPAALRQDGEERNVRLLVTVAALWDVGYSSGARMADLLESAADGERRTMGVERALQVELAAPRATARLMTTLPAIGLGLATLAGAQPLVWLLTSALGLTTLCAGIASNLLGFLWLRRLVQRLEEQL